LGNRIYFLFLLLFISNIFFYGDFGVSIDEPRQHNYGILVIDYFISLGENKSYLTYFDLKYYGPIVEIILSIFTKIFSSFNPYEIRHLGLSFFSLLGSIYFYKILKYWLRDEKVSFLGSIIFYLIPTLFNSSFNQSKDYPFSIIYLISIYYIIRYSRVINKLNYYHVSFLTIMLAFGYLIRVSAGLFSLILLWTIVLIEKKKLFFSINIFKRILFISSLSLFILVLFFPYLHKAPLRKFMEVLTIFSKFYHDIPYLFMGNLVYPKDTPRSFVLVNLFIYLPEIIYLGLIPLFLIITKFKQIPRRIKSFLLYVFLSLFIPLSVQIIMKPYLYNGIRQFMFLIPPFLLITIFGLYLGIKYWSNYFFTGLLVGMIVYSAAINYLYHPYQNIYQNILSNHLLKKSNLFSHYYDYSHIKALAMKLNKIASQSKNEYYLYDPSFDNIYKNLISKGYSDQDAVNFINTLPFKWDTENEMYKYYLSENIKITKDIKQADVLFSEDPLPELSKIEEPIKIDESKIIDEVKVGDHRLGVILRK
jgi:hypothetical protein